MSKLPAPSVSMPCDYRILQSPPKGQILLVLWETAQRSPYSVAMLVNAKKSLQAPLQRCLIGGVKA